MIVVSVIMPVYNADKYLSKAIESVLNQTLKDFELILVDDGSKDNSSVICDTYAAKDKRICVIHQPNGGICAARNTGLKAAIGEYIAFIDHDDLYLPNLLEDNYNLAKKYDADILKYGNQYIQHRKLDLINLKQVYKANHENIVIIDQSNYKEKYKTINDNDWLIYVWDGLFKAELIKAKNLLFDTSFKYGHEDRVFCLELYQWINCMIINPQIYYYHIVYKNSTSRIFSLDRIADTERLIDYEFQLFNQLGITHICPNYWQERVLLYLVIIFNIIKRPESKLTSQEIFNIVMHFREKYYTKSEFNIYPFKSNERRIKKRFYVWLFRHNHLKLLTYGLIFDRKVKAIIQRN